MPETKPPSPAPRFPIGFPVAVGYLGLYAADEKATTRDGRPLPPGLVVCVRLVPDWFEDDDGSTRRHYKFGWEYQLCTARGDAEGDPHGWYTEAELMAKGYAPPEPTPFEPERAGTDDLAACLDPKPDPQAPIVCDMCRQVVPQLDGRAAGDAQQTADTVVCEGCTRELNARSAALRDAERARVIDPAYTPTLAEAVRHPAEFVDGMTEEPAALHFDRPPALRAVRDLDGLDLGENGAG